MKRQIDSTRMSLADNSVLTIQKCIVTLKGLERYSDIRLPNKMDGERVPWELVTGNPETGDMRYKFRRGLIVRKTQRAIPNKVVVIDSKTRRPKLDQDGEYVYRTVNQHETFVSGKVPARFDIALNRWAPIPTDED